MFISIQNDQNLPPFALAIERLASTLLGEIAEVLILRIHGRITALE